MGDPGAPEGPAEQLLYVIEFSDGGPPESGVLTTGTREECEKVRDLIPGISYSGSRPTKLAYTRIIPLDGEEPTE